jgi:ABC-type sugar transport system ATPase subunit
VATIELSHIDKRFGTTHVIRDVSLAIKDGEFVVFVGPSGCGKSTLLRMIAGLESSTGGRLTIDGVDHTATPASQRQVAMVFQSYALYPHMTVEENLTFGMRMRGVDKALIASKLSRAVEILRLADYLARRPGELSGGQCQRVAIGRALVQEPKVFLFDEPLSNLDAELRLAMRVEIKALHRELKTTMIYVTHDQVEAMTLADSIVVLRSGCVEQVGAPLELYNKPANAFVAGFIGSPAMNLMDIAAVPSLAKPEGTHRVGIRPEHIMIDADSALRIRIDNVEALGATTFLYGAMNGQRVCIEARNAAGVAVGDSLGIAFPAERCHWFDAEGRALA